jgi:transmembrane sensor
MDSSETVEWEDLARYFAGECSESEVADIRAWAASDATRTELLDDLRRAWAASAEAPTEWDETAAWARLQARMGVARSGGTAGSGGFGAGGPLRSRTGARLPQASSWWQAAAAIALLLIGGSALVYLGDRPASAPRVASQEVSTDKGERARMQLADGTRVIIGPESRLEVMGGFGDSAREVWLTGEAFFQVSPDAARPFLVHAGTSVTRVLGTEFNVRAYPEDPEVRVVVAEGRVWVQPAGHDTGAEILPGELAEVRLGATEVVTRRVHVDSHVAWRNGRIVFDRTPLGHVCVELERWYGVSVRVGDPELTRYRLTASFRDQPLSEVLDVIAASLDVTHVRTGNTVVFLPRNSPDAVGSQTTALTPQTGRGSR